MCYVLGSSISSPKSVPIYMPHFLLSFSSVSFLLCYPFPSDIMFSVIFSSLELVYLLIYRFHCFYSFVRFSLFLLSFISPVHSNLLSLPEYFHSFHACFPVSGVAVNLDPIVVSDDAFHALGAPITKQLSGGTVNVQPVELSH